MVDTTLIRARLTKEEIFAAKLPEKELFVPQWNGNVVVQGMSAGDRLEMLAKMRKPDSEELDMEQVTFLAIVLGCVEPNFTEDDVPQLKNTSAEALDLITTEWMKLSGINPESAGEARKNS